MPQFWWVNHKQTHRQEIDGQYLWSPKRNRGGSRNEFYTNMRRANPGDFVLSYAAGKVSYVGRIAEFAFSAPKPAEFGEIGHYWSHEGWLLPVFWAPLDRPIRPKDIIETLAPFLPDRYSPLDPVTGGGRQNVYLAAIPEPVYETILAQSQVDWGTLRRGGTNSLSYAAVKERLEDVAEAKIRNDVSLSDTVKDSLVQARRGQGRFRRNVETLERVCRLTGISNPTLLRASHIKPWRLCETGNERLDGMNGLLLTPDADLLFDRGFISFTNDGEVLVSDRVPADDLRRLGFDQLVRDRFGANERPWKWRTESFEASRQAYLEFHRTEVFVG